MIYFITNDSYHIVKYEDKLYDNITVLEGNLKETLEFFREFIKENPLVGYDIETNGLDSWVNSCILKIFGNEETQFVFHIPHCNFKDYLDIILEYYPELLGHNIKFDIKFLYTKYNVLYTKVYDTMVCEQRLYMKSGISNSLENLQIRYLDKYPDKSIREEFVGVDAIKFKIEPRHIYYGVEDVVNLFPIKKKQEVVMERYNLSFLIKDIEFPLISIIAKAEATGFRFNSDKWRSIYEANKEELFNIECKLDEEFRRLRDESYGNPKIGGLSYIPELRKYISGGKWDLPRKKDKVAEFFNEDGTVNTLNLFGEPMKINTFLKSKAKKQIKIKSNSNNINYNSDPQIIYIFGRLGEPLLDKKEKVVHVSFTSNNKINKGVNGYQTNENAFKVYLTALPNTRMKTFIKLLIEHRGLSKATSTYGLNFINNLNAVTGNIHTNFKQCFTDTGRMASGGGKLEPDKPNFQNIPSRASYAIAMRNCFKAKEGYSIGTHDLSGAELIIMCSLSQDLKLLEIAMKDIHSYVAQGSWRLIYQYRASNLIYKYNKLYRQDRSYTNPELKAKVKDLLIKAETYIVDKKTGGGKIRSNFKPMTFGTIYGMFASKAAKTLNIIKEEGQIVIDFIKKEFPDVFTMVENASATARKQGYIVLNTRTNSRAWFPNIILELQGKLNTKLHWKVLSKEESEARNIKIQGTQADMIKEATVELQKWIDDNNWSNEITILSWVHDEIIDEHPTYLDGNSREAWNWLQEGNFLTYNGENYPSFPRVKAQIMRDVCNKYLHNVTMDVDYDVEPFWTK